MNWKGTTFGLTITQANYTRLPKERQDEYRPTLEEANFVDWYGTEVYDPPEQKDNNNENKQ